MSNELGDYQTKIQAWMLWNSQSTKYKLTHPEPPKPTPPKVSDGKQQ